MQSSTNGQILFKHCADQIVRRCLPKEEIESIFNHCHTRDVDGHYGATKMAVKVLQSGFYWSFYLRMLMLKSMHVTLAKEVVTHQEEMRCHSITSLRRNCSVFGY